MNWMMQQLTTLEHDPYALHPLQVAHLAKQAAAILAEREDTIIVARADYVRWNELWHAIEKLAGHNGAGSELMDAITHANAVAAGRAEPFYRK